MEIEQSSLYREIEAVINSGQKPVHYTWYAQIHANGNTYAAMKVLSIDMMRDYELAYADEVVATLVIAGGTYAKRIFPYKDNLEITLYRHPLGETADVVDPERALESERYVATLIGGGDPIMEGTAMNNTTEEALNLMEIFEVKFQLVNKAVEKLRMVSVGGIYRNCTVEDVIRLILTKESQAIEIDGARKPQGVDMIPANNKARRDHVIIPHGTRLVKVPEYIQEKCGGVYSAGLGYYLQGDHWYVYPCYDTTRLNQVTRSVTIINVPQNKMPAIERTYQEEGGNVVILATGAVKFNDDSNVQQLNLGNGVRFADANRFMENFTVTENNRTRASRGANNSEVVVVNRANGNNNVHLSPNPITANSYQEYSRLARRNGSFLSLTWENSNPSLIFPGLMVKMLYLDEDEIKEIDGVVLKAHHYVHLRDQGLLATRHITNTAFSVFVQPKPR